MPGRVARGAVRAVAVGRALLLLLLSIVTATVTVVR